MGRVLNLPTAPTNPANIMAQPDTMNISDNYFNLPAGQSRTLNIHLRNPSRVKGFKLHSFNAKPVSTTI